MKLHGHFHVVCTSPKNGFVLFVVGAASIISSFQNYWLLAIFINLDKSIIWRNI